MVALNKCAVREIHGRSTDRHPDGLFRGSLGITMFLKWVQEGVQHVDFKRENAANTYFRNARIAFVCTPLQITLSDSSGKL